MVLDDWPVERTVYLTLDLECDYGTAIEANSYEAAKRTPALVDFLERHDVPVTCFLQTQVLDEAPGAVDALRRASVPVEVQAHSHTHPSRATADLEYEVEESVSRIRRRFDPDTLGYRPPDGALEPGDYGVLAAHGVQFDAGVFPSIRPGRFNNVTAPRYPFRDVDTGIVELPFSVLSDRVRIPVSLSYLKLLGRPFEWALDRSFPSVVVFDFHMHDLVRPSAYERLPPHYRGVYARRSDAGFSTLERFVRAARKRGYRFGLLSELYLVSDRVLPDRRAPTDRGAN